MSSNEVSSEPKAKVSKESLNVPKAKVSKIVENPQTVVYCGPSIKGVANQYAIFSNGLPGAVKELSESLKPVRRLIVPIDQLSATRVTIMQPGTVENSSYNEILNYIKGGR